MIDATLRVRLLAHAERDAADAVLSDAFAAYPVMRHVLGESRPRDLRKLIALFTAARWLRGHPLLGAFDDDRLVGVATLTPPGEHAVPPALEATAHATWEALGAAAWARYEEIKAAWRRAAPVTADARWHLNMIGVVRTHGGRGFGDAQMRAAIALAGAKPLELTTEDESNLAFYRRYGFAVVGHARVGSHLQTWTLERVP